MAYDGKYWDTQDLGAIVRDEVSHTFTVRNKQTGVAINVDAWDLYFKASAAGGHSTDTIAIAPAAFVKSSSGSGETDRFTLPLSSTDLDVDIGRYIYDIAANTGSEEKVLLRGVLTILDRETVVA